MFERVTFTILLTMRPARQPVPNWTQLVPEHIRCTLQEALADPAYQALPTFRAQCVALPLQATIVLSNMLFHSIGKALQATLISATRQGIYFLPLILILPRYFGLAGIEFTQSISDVFAFSSAVPFLIFFFRSLKREIQKRESAETENLTCGQAA